MRTNRAWNSCQSYKPPLVESQQICQRWQLQLYRLQYTNDSGLSARSASICFPERLKRSAKTGTLLQIWRMAFFFKFPLFVLICTASPETSALIEAGFQLCNSLSCNAAEERASTQKVWIAFNLAHHLPHLCGRSNKPAQWGTAYYCRSATLAMWRLYVRSSLSGGGAPTGRRFRKSKRPTDFHFWSLVPKRAVFTDHCSDESVEDAV